MYIEEELWNWIERRCRRASEGLSSKFLRDIIESCGIWYSIDGIRAETEEFDMTLEDAFRNYWFVIENNKILFTSPDQFAEELDEYLGL